MNKSKGNLLPTQAAIPLTDQKNAMLAAIIATSDDTIISKTLDGIITSWNPAAERMFGYSETEVIGRHISLIIPADRLEEETYIISQIAQGRAIDHFETVRVAKDGNLVTISLSVTPIIDSAGVVVGASKIARDISEQKRAAERRGILAAIVDTSDDAILSKTLGGIITSWNKAAERMFGYTEAEVLGKHISIIIPPERLNEEDYIIGEIASGNRIDHFHTFRQAKDGRLIPISVSVSPIIDDNGRIIGASKIARDISEQVSLQEERARLYEQVSALNDKKDEFIGLASHELKTPLTSISGYLQILSHIVTDEKAQLFLEKARQQVKKLSSLVSDLLDVSKIEAGKLQLSIEQFDIRRVIDNAIELLSHSNHQYQINLHTVIDQLLISGDPNRIEQVVINLLTNAIRYSPGTDRIELYLLQEAGEVKVGVKDDGVGIANDQLVDIFSRFYRVDDANPMISGLGIGLYLSQDIINRHSGKIWAESEPGKGSTFWFSLPLK
ncbi:MAG: PAS domain S-box protein [Bacteroidota bacterium]